MKKIIPAFSAHPEPQHGFLKLQGSFEEYNISVEADKIIVTDLRDKGFGTHTYPKTFYKVGFDDIREISLLNRNPYHVSDIIDFDGVSTIEIDQNRLTYNDKDFYSKKISIKSVGDAKGGKVDFYNGKIEFTPDPSYEGIRQFSYTVRNEDNFVNTKKINVYLRESHHPNDPKFFDQWYLQELKVEKAWPDYTGKGVSIAIYDDSFIPDHDDLDINRQEYQLDHAGGSISQHGFWVANVIAAKNNNGIGGTGIAYDADVSSYQLSFADEHKMNFDFFKGHDVVNNSWGYTNILLDNNELEAQHVKLIDQLRDAAMNGRNSAGTNIIFAAGNSGDFGDDSSCSFITSSSYVITVGGYTKSAEDIGYGTKIFEYTTTGGTVLVSAPATDFHVPYAGGISFAGSKMNFGNNARSVAGTSFGTPAVSAVVALMLQANSNLGFRDVQDILAYSAVHSKKDATINAATNWNGGGMLFDRQHGFGVVDAHAAVRLSEVWNSFHTFKNYEQTFTHPLQFVDVLKFKEEKEAKEVREKSIELPIKISDNVRIEFAKLYLNIELPSSVSNYQFVLKSPSGTSFEILNEVGKSPFFNFSEIAQKSINFEFGLQHARGESSAGEWKLNIIQKSESGDAKDDGIVLLGYSLNFMGKPINEEQELIFTDQFSELYTTSRAKIGNEYKTINASAVSDNVNIDLTLKSDSEIAGNKIVLGRNNKIKTIKTGDGDDIIKCSDEGNIVYPGRGDDIIRLNHGSDTIVYTNYKLHGLGDDTIIGFDPEMDKIAILGGLSTEQLMSSIKDTSSGGYISTTIKFEDWSITLNDVEHTKVTADIFII